MFKLNRFLSQEMLQQNKKSSKKKKICDKQYFVANNLFRKTLQKIFTKL